MKSAKQLWLVGARHPKTGSRENATVNAASKREALAMARQIFPGWFDVMARTKNPGFFGSEATAKAKRVTKVRAIKDRTTGELGEIVGAAKGGFVKVKWRNRDKPTLIQRSEIVAVRAKRNPGGYRVEKSGSDYIVGRDVSGEFVPTRSGRYSFKTRKAAQDKADALNRRPNPHPSHARLSVKRSVKAGNLLRRAQTLFKKAAKFEASGFKAEANKTAAQALALQRRFYASGAGASGYPKGTHVEGPVGRLPNPSGVAATRKAIASLRKVLAGGTVEGVRIGDAGITREWLRESIKAHEELLAKQEATARLRAHRARKNPSVTELAETFQGKVSGAISEYKAASNAPADLARIGKLIFLKLRDVRRQIAAPGAMVAVDMRGRLWIVGKQSLFSPKAKAGSLNDFGEIEKICYETAKTHIADGERTEYVHEFGEDGGRRPRLLIDHEGMPILRGGDYKIKAEGIVN